MTAPSELRRTRTPEWIGLAVLAAVLLVGLTWSKWLPYWDQSWTLAQTPSWSSGVVFEAAGKSPSISGALDFTGAYFAAVWRALAVALVVAAVIDSMVPRQWLLAVLNRRSAAGQAVTGAAVSLPTMMCSCCAAPVAAGLRRSGVARGAVLAYWVGNPLLNPAVLIFLLLLLPWEWAAVRLLVGLLIVVGASAVIGSLLSARDRRLGTATPGLQSPTSPATAAGLPLRFLSSLGRLSLLLIPVHLGLVFLLGLLSPWFEGVYGIETRLGAAAVLIAALVGTLMVIPTGGEIPVVLALLAAGAGTGVAGALLITLPALSIPSAVMVCRELGWRAAAGMALAVAAGGLGAGALLLALG